jgi:hypothetical protein
MHGQPTLPATHAHVLKRYDAFISELYECVETKQAEAMKLEFLNRVSRLDSNSVDR